MKKTFLVFCMLLVNVATWAAESTHLRVHLADGGAMLFSLEEQIVLRFPTAETLQIKTSTTQEVKAIDSLLKLTFGDALQSSVENIRIDNETNVHKVLENGKMVIIRDGVKYNVLGVRLQIK